MHYVPQVSIVINNYNYGRFLPEAIDSALQQTYTAIEVLVVDDGSVDNSRDVLAEYHGRVIPVLKENGGQASAFNAGFQACHGEIVCFLDADDKLCPNAIETAVPLMEEKEAVNVHWPLHVMDGSGRRTGEVFPRRSLPEEGIYQRVLQEGPIYDCNVTPPTSGNAWARHFLQRVLPMPEPAYRLGADIYLIALAPIYGRQCRAARPLGCYRAHGANNYCNRPLDDQRVKHYAQRFETVSSDLFQHLCQQGIRVDREMWRQRNFNYLWPTRLLEARNDIRSLVPEGDAYILIDGAEWGSNQSVSNRRAIPFLERDGVYWGCPPNDATAIEELERLRTDGATFVVLWWTAFWWLDHYKEFAVYVKSRFHQLVNNERLIVFSLREGPSH